MGWLTSCSKIVMGLALVHFNLLNRKIWTFYLKKLKKYMISLWIILWKCQKLGFLLQIGEFFFPKFNIRSKKSFLIQTIYILKFWLQEQSFLNQDSFLNSSFLNWDFSVPVDFPTATASGLQTVLFATSSDSFFPSHNSSLNSSEIFPIKKLQFTRIPRMCYPCVL